ncbi:MAG: hypothetical protein COV98_03565 [Candidatus Altarchaeum sp. CG12_big_fil_rev_8_21_14_0_65_33_22]|nr:MAG: hypothetical protein COV98_03565 [Candidatus Altarchaeum sp. CG12_big_fil_rev_8_21_14_0_65_33_22]PIV28659.1 MAG: hypothetical protein COS36_01470 [Candidatus Altarchaeum sp. CG03_land_8_20_14_0_80_32_618]PIX48808.1 MAG: hypothetical protein COZ53_02745 [Candidatus Altarchaeum sp. CG_4_8_14_3_um_filter_33_2054]
MNSEIITAESVIEALPRILTERPDILYEVYAIIDKKFSTKDDLIRILIEIEKSREESNRRFEAMDRRFEAMDRRFEEAREESNRRFEVVDRRFEAMDRRFEEAREESNKRFETVDRRFEELIFVIGKIKEDVKNHEDFVNIIVGGFQRRAGRSLENMVAGTLRYALDRGDITSDNLKLREKVKDTRGMLGKKDREYEYDILLSKGKDIVFEIKSCPDKEDIERFADKCELIIKEKCPDKNKIEKVLVTLDKSSEVVETCAENDIILV